MITHVKGNRYTETTTDSFRRPDFFWGLPVTFTKCKWGDFPITATRTGTWDWINAFETHHKSPISLRLCTAGPRRYL